MTTLKTDTHVIKPATIHGANIFSIVNPRTGEEVNRVATYAEALKAQAAANADAKKRGL